MRKTLTLAAALALCSAAAFAQRPTTEGIADPGAIYVSLDEASELYYDFVNRGLPSDVRGMEPEEKVERLNDLTNRLRYLEAVAAHESREGTLSLYDVGAINQNATSHYADVFSRAGYESEAADLLDGMRSGPLEGTDLEILVEVKLAELIHRIPLTPEFTREDRAARIVEVAEDALAHAEFFRTPVWGDLVEQNEIRYHLAKARKDLGDAAGYLSSLEVYLRESCEHNLLVQPKLERIWEEYESFSRRFGRRISPDVESAVAVTIQRMGTEQYTLGRQSRVAPDVFREYRLAMEEIIEANLRIER